MLSSQPFRHTNKQTGTQTDRQTESRATPNSNRRLGCHLRHPMMECWVLTQRGVARA